MSQVKKVAFIGLGNMGYHMAINLMRKGGYAVAGFDVNKQVLDKFKSEGGSAMKEPRDCEGADAVVTMLPSNQHVVNTFLDPNTGVLTSSKLKSTAVLIDSSTISPAVARKVAETAQSRNFTFVDAPVSGGVNGAKAGTLTFMVGGSQDAYGKAKVYLENMDKNIVHCGDIGTCHFVTTASLQYKILRQSQEAWYTWSTRQLVSFDSTLLFLEICKVIFYFQALDNVRYSVLLVYVIIIVRKIAIKFRTIPKCCSVFTKRDQTDICS